MKCPLTNLPLKYNEEEQYLFSILRKGENDKIIKYPINEEEFIDMTSINAKVEDYNGEFD